LPSFSFYWRPFLPLPGWRLTWLSALINALPGNSSVNTVQHVTIDEAVFSMSSAPRPVLVTDQ
jgi:hypothetical protein